MIIQIIPAKSMHPRLILIICAIFFLAASLLAEEGHAQQVPRDPFVSISDRLALEQKSQDSPESLPYPVVLKGTLCAGDVLVAMLNNEIVKQGQKWQDFYVADIERDKVILEWRGKKFAITLK